jgi:hypothetical protein
VGRSLWLEDGSVVYNCCWTSPAQSFSSPSPLGLATIFYCIRFETFFSLPPTTRRATEEVFNTASTRDSSQLLGTHAQSYIIFLNTVKLNELKFTKALPFYSCHAGGIEVTMSNSFSVLLCCHGNAFVNLRCRGNKCLSGRCLTKLLPLLLLFRLLGSVYLAVA